MFASLKLVFLFLPILGLSGAAMAQDAAAARAVGAVKAIQGNVISLKTDAGADVTIHVSEGARILRTAPGQTDLKTATPIQLSEVQTGDRILARGKGSEDGKTIAANTVVVMKQTDVAAKQQKEKEDWQRRGVGGPVKTVDAATGTITLATTGVTAQSVAVRAGKDTIVRQYSQESVKFDDAKLSSLSEVKTGDQLRARGTRSTDGASLTAEEIVFGTFRNVAGTISSIDAANQTMTVMDLATKKPVVVKITPESQMHKLPQMVAQALAFRLRGGTLGGETAGATGGNAQPAAAGQRPQGAPAQGAGQAGGPRQGGPGGSNGGGGMRNADLSQMLARLPQLALSELQKGDALMIVTTQGNGTDVSAVTLLAGVEPILTAPNASTILSPWNIGTGGAGEAQ
jgi:co-chaperonin GroES (HSP10)